MQANLHIFGFFESFDTVDIMNGPICHSKKKKKITNETIAISNGNIYLYKVLISDIMYS